MQQQAALQHILADGRARLAQLYASGLPADEMRRRKHEVLAATVAAARAYEQRAGLRTGYDAWFEAGLNNAHLASVATYFDCVPGFERLLAAQGGDLPAYYAQVRALARGPVAARRALCEAAAGA